MSDREDGADDAAHAVAEIRQPREVLASILNHAPDFLAHITADGRFLFLNRFVPGLGPADLLNRTIYDFIEPRYHATIRATIARVVETRDQQHYASEAIGRDLEMVHYDTRVAPVIEDGVVTSLILIATDVTRLKDAETARADSEQALQHVLAATGMGTWWWDVEGNQVGHDAVATEILGLIEPRDFEAALAIIHPADRVRVAAALALACETGNYTASEHRIVRADGSIRWVTASGRRILTAKGGVRLVGGLIDVTTRKQLETQLAQAQKLDGIGRLAGGIAHDFNNMLTVILSYAEMAAAMVPPGSRLAEYLGQIRSAGECSAALTSQLLVFARQQVIEPRVLDLATIVLEIDKLLHRVLGSNIEIVTVLRARHHVKIDPNQLEQVLVNLATNARDAMPDGGRLTIETADLELDASYAAIHPGVMPGGYVMLAVSDSGTGIAAHDLGQIFEPFFTTKPQGKGTGLGLATVYGVVAQNGGHIAVGSEPGRGTTFKIHLPVAVGEPVVAVRAADVVERGGSETILLVEDDAIVRTIALETLTRAGYRVLEARHGVEALTIARDHGGSIDLLLTDLVMPQLGGEQLAQQLATDRRDLAVLFVSGHTDNAVVLVGGLDLLAKPFTPSTLLRRVRQSLECRTARLATV